MGTCVGLSVTSQQIARVDTLRIYASGIATGLQVTTGMRPSDLPIRVAVLLPIGANGRLHLDVDGRLGGTSVGQGGSDVTVTPGASVSMLVDIEPGGMTVTDLSMPTDAGGDLTSSDMPQPDLAGADLTMPDLAGADFTMPDDLTVPIDLTAPPDLVQPPDMTDCTPSSASVPHFVDPVNGTDDANHGGEAGGCALRTLSAALTGAFAGSGKIVLASGTYNISSPIQLTSGQGLFCDSVATISGQGPGGGGQVTILLAGSGNVVDSCTISGNDPMGTMNSCIEIDAMATNAVVTNNSIGSCGGPGLRIFGGTSADISGNRIVTNIDPAIVIPGNATLDISNNSFFDMTVNDVTCPGSPTITGSGNTSGTMGATCGPMCNCPMGF